MKYNGTLFPEPENEAETVYLFSKYHKKLGFDKILKISSCLFPDIIAKRGRKTVKIEMEYKLSSFMYHYFVFKDEFKFISKFSCGDRVSECIWEYNKKDKMWRKWVVISINEEEISKELMKLGRFVDDSEQILTTTGNKTGLVYKTLKTDVDIIIYWIDDCEIDDNIERINLREQLEMINGLDKRQLTLD